MPSTAQSPSPHPTSLARAGLLVLVAGSIAALSPLPAFANPSLQHELRRAGLESLARPAAAPAFTLPLLDGGQASLADYRGRFVLLTFFATWCGPCRAELPSLERLHQEASGSGLEVVAVSVDERRNALPAFVRRLGLTFPVLWDERGEVGAAYRASSIPVTYLVDPAGSMVAVARGARDWSRAQGLVRALAQGQSSAVAAATLPPAAAPPEAVLELPAPELAARLLDPEPTLGCPFELAVTVSFPGSPSDYLLKPPTVTLPEGLKALGISAESGSRREGSPGEGTALTYRLRFEAERLGRFELGAVTLRFQSAGSTEERTVTAEVPVLTVLPLTVAGQPVSRLLWAGLGALVLGAGAVLGVRLRARRRQRARQAEARDERIAPLEAALACARRQRLEGRNVCEFLALAHATKLLGLEAEAATRLEQALERARYGNQAPSEGELGSMRREAERHLAELVRAEDRRNEERLKHSVLAPTLTPSAASLPARD